MKILIFSSLAKNSGCYLRAKYVGQALKQQGHIVKVVPAMQGMPFMLDVVLSLFLYLYHALFTSFDFGFGIKPYPNVVWPLLLKKLVSKSKIGVDIDDIDYGYRKGLIPFVSKLVQLPFPRFFDVVTYHNDNLFSYIQKEFKVKPEKMFRLDQGVDFSVFKTRISSAFKKKITKQWNLKKGKTFVYTAHLNVASDLDDILEAFKLVSQKDKEVKLIVAGGGPMYQDFCKLSESMGLKDKTFFTGYLPPDKIRNYLLIADFALVYYKDKFVNYYRTSMKIREYLGMKCQVIANDVGDLKQFKPYVYQSKTGVQAYSKKILNVLKNGVDKRNLKAYQFIKKEYNWSVIGKKFSDYLLAL